MRGHALPTGAAYEGPRSAVVRGQWLPTIKTHLQDSVRALASLSKQTEELRAAPWRGAEATSTAWARWGRLRPGAGSQRGQAAGVLGGRGGA